MTPPSLKLDRTLLISVLLLISLGIVMVSSASMVSAQGPGLSQSRFLIKQLIATALGLVLMVGTLNTPIKTYTRWQNMWVILSIILLIAVLIPGIGHEVNGSRRWIRLGPFSLQVSEGVKCLMLFYLCNYLIRVGDKIQHDVRTLLPPLGLFGLVALLLLLEPDFGATMVIMVTMLGVLFMAGVPYKWFFILIAGSLVSAAGLIWNSPYRFARLTGFLDPWANQYDTGYQLTQSLIAIGRGGWFGVGLGESIQKLYYLPEAHTDFILAIIAEELGLVGVFMMLIVACALIWRGLSIGRRAYLQERTFDAHLAFGITFWLSLQFIINIGVNIGLLPTKGLTLPFISYSGSSLMIDCAIIGILCRIHLEGQLDEQDNTVHGRRDRGACNPSADASQ